MSVQSALVTDDTVAVTFSQDEGRGFQPPVTLQLNGRPATLSHALPSPDEPAIACYALKNRVRARDDLTWSYVGTHIFIQYLNGRVPALVTAKTVRSR